MTITTTAAPEKERYSAVLHKRHGWLEAPEGGWIEETGKSFWLCAGPDRPTGTVIFPFGTRWNATSIDAVRLVATTTEAEPEFVLHLENGNTIRTESYQAHDAGCSYVRVCGPDGKEIAYWTYTEWVEDPQLVMGAFLGSAGSAPDGEEHS